MQLQTEIPVIFIFVYFISLFVMHLYTYSLVYLFQSAWLRDGLVTAMAELICARHSSRPGWLEAECT